MTKRITTILAISVLLTSAQAAIAAPQVVTLNVENATCELCGPIVKRALSRVAGVTSVKIADGKKGTMATVAFDDARTNVETLVAASTNAGYPARAAN